MLWLEETAQELKGLADGFLDEELGPDRVFNIAQWSRRQLQRVEDEVGNSSLGLS